MLLGYKGVYLIAGVILAIQTYNVKIKKLRDSKQIVISVFAVSIVSVVLSLIGVFVSDRPNVFYALLAIFILSAITGVLGLFFIPRVSHAHLGLKDFFQILGLLYSIVGIMIY